MASILDIDPTPMQVTVGSLHTMQPAPQVSEDYRDILSQIHTDWGNEVASHLVTAEDELLTLYGKGLTNALGDNDHIAGFRCLIYIGWRT